MTGCASRTFVHNAPPPCTVLVVDDDGLIRDQLRIVLQRAGYTVETAETAQQALLDIQRTQCQVVIADWEMPDMDGASLCRAIRRKRRDAYVYVLMFTIRNRTGDVLAGLQAGADDYIVKGAPMAELVARLDSGRRIIANHNSARQIQSANGAPSARPESVSEPARVAKDLPFLAVALAREYEACRSRGAPISLLLCVPDHAAGAHDRQRAKARSEFLTRVRREVPKLLLESDWIARCGNGGFVVVLPDTGLDGAMFAGEKIRAAVAAIAAGRQARANSISVTLSIGAASIDAASDLQRYMPMHLLRTSVHCLVQSRRQGGNRMTAALVSQGS